MDSCMCHRERNKRQLVNIVGIHILFTIHRSRVHVTNHALFIMKTYISSHHYTIISYPYKNNSIKVSHYRARALMTVLLFDPVHYIALKTISSPSVKTYNYIYRQNSSLQHRGTLLQYVKKKTHIYLNTRVNTSR